MYKGIACGMVATALVHCIMQWFFPSFYYKKRGLFVALLLSIVLSLGALLVLPT